MLCIWSHLLAQSVDKGGHVDNYRITVGSGTGNKLIFSASFANRRT